MNNLSINQKYAEVVVEDKEKLSLKRSFYGLTFSQIKNKPLAELSEFLDSRARRCIKRGLVDKYAKVYSNLIKKTDAGVPYRTHVRNLLIIPSIVGRSVSVHNGKNFIPLMISEEMLGRKIGEFVQTKSKVKHSGKKGIGATKGNSSVAKK
jgi:small subunit ribosomal protein S19